MNKTIVCRLLAAMTMTVVAWQVVSLQSSVAAASMTQRQFVLQDPLRRKQLLVKATWVQGQTRYPVVILSHGAGGAISQYGYLARSLAAHGYLCIQPAHADSNAVRLNGSSLESGLMDTLQRVAVDSPGWADRCRDLSLVIDSLPVISASVPTLKGRIDGSAVGVAGHSFGAFTGMLLGGAQAPPTQLGTLPLQKDGRVKAVVALSPQGVRRDPRAFGFADTGAWRRLTLPVLFITGDYDGSIWTTVQERQSAYTYSPAGNKYFMNVRNAQHMTFLDPRAQWGAQIRLAASLMDSGAPVVDAKTEAAQLAAVELAVDTFFDAYLKNAPGALQQLTNPNGLTRRLQSIASFSHR